MPTPATHHKTAGKELESAEMVVNKEQKATHRTKT